MQRALSRATSHIWFERSEVKDRTLVAKRLIFYLNNITVELHEVVSDVTIFLWGTNICDVLIIEIKISEFVVVENINEAVQPEKV